MWRAHSRASDHPRKDHGGFESKREQNVGVLMMKHKIAIAVGMVLLLCPIASIWAHHSTTALFDMGRRISVTGALTKVDWVNPHIKVAIEANGEGGKIDHWLFESNPPSWYRSVGLARADFAK